MTLTLALLLAAATPSPTPDYRADARALDALIVANYAYPERLPPPSATLDAEREAVDSRRALLRYAGRRLATLADHHAITGSSLADDFGLVPSYADLWVEQRGADYVVTAVRPDSASALAGVRACAVLAAVDGVSMHDAVARYWADLGLVPNAEQRSFAARVLAAGRRDRPRRLTFSEAGLTRTLDLPNLYARANRKPPVQVVREAAGTRIVLFDSLGDTETIAAFDAALAGVPHGAPIAVDLTQTPGGGNTVVARGIMGWFARAPTGYQIHSSPSEERTTGIARQWIEQVLPRAGKRHTGSVTVHVGRWTGSMGEGLALGLRTLGARIEGGPMAGLRGAIEDFRLPSSGLTIKLPVERLMTAEGQPRELALTDTPRCGITGL